MNPPGATAANPFRHKSRQRLIVKQKQAQPDGQKIEERVISRDQDQYLEPDHQPRSEQSNSARHENKERNAEFDGEHRKRRRPLKALRQLVRIPCENRRQGLRVIVKIERRQIPPGRIVAQQLYRSRKQAEPEYQPSEQPHDGLRPAQKNRQESAFDQQRVPLESEELLPRRAQR